jgi:hypothetical protein
MGSEMIEIQKGGSNENNRVTYKSYTPDPAVLDGQGKDVYSSGGLLRVDGVDFVEVDGFTLRNIDSSGSSGGEALFWVSNGGLLHNCSFADFVQPASAGGGAWLEIGLEPGESTTIEDCDFGWAADEALSSHTGVLNSNITINRCTFSGCGSNMAVQTTQLPANITFNDCEFNGDSSYGAKPSIAGHNKDNTHYNRCKFRYAAERVYGTFSYCEFRAQGRIFDAIDSKSSRYTNCTLDFEGNFQSVFYLSKDNPDLVVENCIIYNGRWAFFFNAAAAGDDVVTLGPNVRIRNNRHYNMEAGVYVHLGTIDATGSDYEEPLEVNPLFVDAPNNDYNLQAASPLIAAGVSSTYLTYPEKDIVGNIVPWPEGGAPDIGAYEYGSQQSYTNPPALTPIDNVNLTLGDTFTPIQAINSGDPVDTWALNAEAIAAGLAIDSAGLITWAAVTVQSNLSVTVTATNSTGSDTETFIINAVPKAPVITTIANQQASQGEAFDIDAELTEPGNMTGTTFYVDGPEGMTINPATGEISDPDAQP